MSNFSVEYEPAQTGTFHADLQAGLGDFAAAYAEPEYEAEIEP